MDKEQAIKIVASVCSQFKGTLDEHKKIQEAIAVISKELVAKE